MIEKGIVLNSRRDLSYLFWVENESFYTRKNGLSFSPFSMWDYWVIDDVTSLDWMDECLVRVFLFLGTTRIEGICCGTASGSSGTSRSPGLRCLGRRVRPHTYGHCFCLGSLSLLYLGKAAFPCFIWAQAVVKLDFGHIY